MAGEQLHIMMLGSLCVSKGRAKREVVPITFLCFFFLKAGTIEPNVLLGSLSERLSCFLLNFEGANEGRVEGEKVFWEKTIFFSLSYLNYLLYILEKLQD